MFDVERDNAEYFKSLSPREELSCFLATRADCLLFSGMLADAHATYKKALDLWPHNFPARYSLERTEKLLQRLKERQRNIEALRRAEAIIARQQMRLRTDPRVMIPGLPQVPGGGPGSILSPGNGVPGSPPPFPLYPYEDPTLPPERRFGNLDGSGWRPPSTQEYIDAQNRRNEQLRRYGRAILYGSERGSIQRAPMPLPISRPAPAPDAMPASERP